MILYICNAHIMCITLKEFRISLGNRTRDDHFDYIEPSVKIEINLKTCIEITFIANIVPVNIRT